MLDVTIFGVLVAVLALAVVGWSLLRAAALGDKSAEQVRQREVLSRRLDKIQARRMR